MGARMKVLLGFIVVLAVGAVGAVGLFLYSIHRSVARLDAVPLAPANYQPATLELIKLCQSDPGLYSEPSLSMFGSFNPVWAPPSVSKLHPEFLQVTPDNVTVTWGGGFYHCGWQLQRSAGAADNSSYAWTLSFFSENRAAPQVLLTIAVPADQRLTKDEFFNQVLAEIDQRLASQVEDGEFTDAAYYLVPSRCFFLQHHQRLDLLPSQVRKGANYPHDWRDILLAYLLNHAAGDRAAGDRLRQWASQTPGPAAWLYAAYAFYESGDAAAGDAAIAKALASKTDDPEWIDKNIPEFELGMAVRLYDAGRFSECVRFCDGILSSRHRDFTTQPSVQSLRDAAAAPATSRPTASPAFDKYTCEDPFGGFDLKLLYAAATPTTAPSTRQKR
jgi:hypothetical protein